MTIGGLAKLSDPLRILITGFGAFPGAPFNPTEPLVARLLQLRRPAFGEVELSGHIFPVTYSDVDRQLPDLLAMHRPHALLMFGLASRTPHVRIETRARNAVTMLWPDAAHARVRKGSISGGADALMFGPHTAKLLRAADSTGVDARASRDAGSYLCNYLSWRAIEATCARQTVRASPPSCMCRCSRAAALPGAKARRTASRWRNWSMPAKPCCWRW